ncbi:MAG TPA: tetratricopeptide repeat protein [Pyrinomonadaceae bacterium]
MRKLTCVVAVALCSAISIAAQMISPSAGDTGLGGDNSITGTVIAAGQRVQRHVTVRLQTMTKGDRIVVTDDYGNFAFRNLPSGDYTLVIDKEKDFQPATQAVTIIQPRGIPGQIYNISMRLEWKATAGPRPGVINAEFADVPERARTFYTTGLEESKKGNYKEAVEQLKLAIAEYPSFMQAYNEMGVQYLKLNQLEDADAAFQQAAKINPDAIPPLVNRGIVNVMMKRYGESVPILRKAIAKDDQSAVAHYFLGQAMANLGLFDDAEKELQLSIKLGTDQMKEAHRLLAIIYTNRGNKRLAADELEAYLKLAPTAPDAEKLKEKIRELRESNP